MDDEILTVEEAARLLKIAPETVLGLLMAADLAGRNIGGEWRTTKRALVGFVDGIGLSTSCCGPGITGRQTPRTAMPLPWPSTRPGTSPSPGWLK